MCGIVGAIGNAKIAEFILNGLKKLEYRGYDSAGIAVSDGKNFKKIKAVGRIANLEEKLKDSDLSGYVGIGHTRWATHGKPSEINAHPHTCSDVTVVHNGIIENYKELKTELYERGYSFESETDSEVLAVLIQSFLKEGYSEFDAVKEALIRVEGAYGLGIIFKKNPDILIAARRGSPLAVGIDEHANYLGSDAMALMEVTNKIAYLNDGELAVLKKDEVRFYNVDGEIINKQIREIDREKFDTEKGDYPHYMLKEIFEQPEKIKDTFNSIYDNAKGEILLPKTNVNLYVIDKITLVACGTSFYAALIAKYWIESLSPVTIEIDVASEFRYRNAYMKKGGLAVFISQSGETADTLAALRFAKENHQTIVSIVNVPESTIARESDIVFYMKAGPEIGVASTKAFTAQLIMLAAVAILIGRAKETLPKGSEQKLTDSLKKLPSLAKKVLSKSGEMKKIAEKYLKDAKTVLYLGRAMSYPIALEGALKLKELSYIHAEGMAAGEMKHGPIALIDEDVPVVFVAPSDGLFEKTASNIEEVKARGGKVIMLTDHKGAEKFEGRVDAIIELPYVDGFVEPILYALPIQLLAYYTAVALDRDVDKPRNLAKSVTVE
jgi:glucosamine--fructose-6-phosphate aminotransferase (isomerizing)